MAGPRVWSYSDALEALARWLKMAGHPSSDQDQLRDVLLTEYDLITSQHDWPFLQTVGRITLNASITDTGSYVASTRTLTLDTETFPSWAIDGCVMLNGTLCDIESASGSTAILNSVMELPVDMADQEVTVFQWCYPLPNDFLAIGTPIQHAAWTLGQHTSFDELLQMMMHSFQTGDVSRYSIAHIADRVGSMGMYVYPAPTDTEEMTFPYKRFPRPLVHSGHGADAQGTVTVTGTAVVGVGTAFDSSMVGSLFRIGKSATTPTGMEGKDSYAEQRTVAAVGGTTALTLDAAPAANAAGVGYRVTDYIDLNVGCYRALIAACQSRLATDKNLESAGKMYAAYQRTLHEAKVSAAPIRDRGVAGYISRRGVRVADQFRGSPGYGDPNYTG